jgi:hypothetical protein
MMQKPIVLKGNSPFIEEDKSSSPDRIVPTQCIFYHKNDQFYSSEVPPPGYQENAAFS